MPNFSQWTGAGHIGRDAECRDAGSTKVVSFSVAVTRKRKDNETVTWFRCQWFGERAVKVMQFLTKGKAVLVTGELYEREYERDGHARKSLEVDVRDLTLLGGKDQAERKPAAPATTTPQADACEEPPF